MNDKRHECGVPKTKKTTVVFSVEVVTDDLYAVIDGGDLSLESRESLRQRLHKFATGVSDEGVGDQALGGDPGSAGS